MECHVGKLKSVHIKYFAYGSYVTSLIVCLCLGAGVRYFVLSMAIASLVYHSTLRARRRTTDDYNNPSQTS